jgi:hypothetical protein
MGPVWAISLLFVGLFSLASSSGTERSESVANSVISCDVCIIGGGSAGTYAAVRLRDLGQSVVVVEAKCTWRPYKYIRRHNDWRNLGLWSHGLAQYYGCHNFF